MPENKSSQGHSSIAAKIAAMTDHPSGGMLPNCGSLPPHVAQCIAFLESLWSKSELATCKSQSERRSDALTISLPAQFARFELRELLGVGGFGAVYRAFDPDLEREVAIKIPRPEVLFSAELRARFHCEAKFAALLDHPGIIPVHGTGEVWPAWYIVTGLSKGETLAAWLSAQKELPNERVAARSIAKVAEAVHHAHVRGVLHRDLKPSNILLEPVESHQHDDLPFYPRVTDFGLAKILNSSRDLSQGRHILGTPRYMAPEQRQGQTADIGIPTDIYALGVILCEMLMGNTGQVLNEAESSSVQSSCELALNLRLKRPGVSRDLAAVCEKCLESKPEDRYVSALELAQDLHRFLRHEPTIARPLRPHQRIAKWTRRRPVVAGLCLAVIALLATSVIGPSLMLIREREIRRAAEWKQAFAEKAIDDMYLSIDAWASGAPASEELRRKFLTSAMDYYEALSQENSNDVRTLEKIGRALQRLANVQAHLRLPYLACESRQRGLRILDDLCQRFPGRDDFAFARFENLLVSASDYAAIGQRDKQHLSQNEAYQAIEKLVAKHPDNPTYRDAANAARNSWGVALSNAGHSKEAGIIWRRVVHDAEELATLYPKELLYKKHAAIALSYLAAFADLERDYPKAADLYARSASIAEHLAHRFPEFHDLSVCHVRHLANVALMEYRLKKNEQADEHARMVEHVLKDLIKRFPVEPDVRGLEVRVYWDLAVAQYEIGQVATANSCFSKSFERADHLLRERPDYPPHRGFYIAMLRTCPQESFRNMALADQLEQGEAVADTVFPHQQK